MLAAPSFAFSAALGSALVCGAVVASAWAVFEAVKPRLRARDPYDLGELRRVHEEEELRALEPSEAITVPMRVVCSRCFSEYDGRLGACPRCGAGG